MAEIPLHWLPITELSRKIHDGALSPVALMEGLLTRAEAIDPALNAFRLIPRERALLAAEAAELALRAGHDLGPLHGIPFAAKDIIDVQGLPTTAGSDALADNVADTDATVVGLLIRAGMVLMGKTQTVQFAMGAPGINHHHGTPQNPWSETHHVPGGSSNGSAVAVGAGLVPMALGSDTGGSVRIPAGLCGTVGLKTTVGQVSRAGVFPLSATLDSVGPLTRTVADAALVYQAMHGADPRDRSTAGAVPQDVMSALEGGVHGLRIAIAETLFWDEADAEVEQAVRAAGEVLAGLGAQLDSIAFPEAAEVLEANPRLLISSVEASAAHRECLGDDFDAYDSVLAFRVAEGRAASAVDYLGAVKACEALAARAEASLQDVDAFIAPTTMQAALPLAEVDATTDTYKRWNAGYSRNTCIGNLLGLCAISVPCGFTSKGMPIGLMIHAKGRAEGMALRIAHAYEQATDWHRQWPDLSWAEK
ncbi:MAG: amidase [Alphaproteobacteria bacterium]|nr:amidase [Alphaproteobacteria bacterium]